MKKNTTFLIALFTLSHLLCAQTNKSLEATLLETPLKIDGVLNESAYAQAQAATDFLQIWPSNGSPAMQVTKAYIFYDQTAVYVGAMLYDEHPDSIFNYISGRDEIGMSDYFGVYFDPYNQGQLAYGFFLTPANSQTDLKAIKRGGDNEDGNWDAVWESATRLTDHGWALEMRIPYSALRFPEKPAHTWGLNMFRNIRRYDSNNSWNFIDRKIQGFIQQEGQLTGIKNIKPPVRLSATPYGSVYAENSEARKALDKDPTSFTYKMGLDVKYGISESFTLDMMLVPDFGQVQSDDKQLNLSPYELYYDEKRQFFNEGTELFQRGDIFYSRRIGAAPKFLDKATDQLRENEKIRLTPDQTQLINATKISGRTMGGLGVGVLNAMSLDSYATLHDTLSGQERKVLVQPFTNYNITVVDKSLRNSSYLSFINSNVSMANNPFMANVTATEFVLRTKNNQYTLEGQGSMSHRGTSNDMDQGMLGNLKVGKTGGQLGYQARAEITSKHYNHNDLGYMRRNNEARYRANISYHLVKPYGMFVDWEAELWAEHIRLWQPNRYMENNMGFFTWGKFHNNYNGFIDGGLEQEAHDYYRPRVEGRYYRLARHFWWNTRLNTDSRQAVNGWLYLGGSNYPTTDQNELRSSIGVNCRIGQRLQLSYWCNWNVDRNVCDYSENTGNTTTDTVFFAKRMANHITNVFKLKFALNSKISAECRMRHYSSAINNFDNYILQADGRLSNTDARHANDQSYNAFNVDASLRWIFAPGSELVVAWKNAIEDSQDQYIGRYGDNVHQLREAYQTNTLSVKMLYYIDYNTLVRQ